MKKLLVLFALILSVVFVAPAQKNSIPSNVQKDIDAIKKMETDINAEFLKGKADLFEKYVIQTARFTAPDGSQLSRDAITIAVRNGSLKFTQSNLSDLHVIVFVDTAIATYLTDDKGTFNGQSIDGKTRWMDTWARIGGNWTCVGLAGTPLMEMPTK